jgi:hypothetical protein
MILKKADMGQEQHGQYYIAVCSNVQYLKIFFLKKNAEGKREEHEPQPNLYILLAIISSYTIANLLSEISQ